MKYARALALSFCLISAIAAAQTTGDSPSEEGGPGMMRRGGGMREWRFGHRPMNDPEPTDEQWNEAAEFMKNKSPKRWEAFAAMPEDRRDMLRRMIYRRYEGLRSLEKSDAEMYQLKMQQMQVDDELFGLAAALRNADDQEGVAEKLNKRVADKVDLELKERELRLKSMQKALDDDRSHKDELIKKRLEQVRSGRFLKGPHFGHPPATQSTTGESD